MDQMERYLPGDAQIEGNRAWIDAAEGKAADSLKRMEAAVAVQPTDRTFRAGVNAGYYMTHQFDRVFDDEWSDFIIWALFNLDRREEATIIAQTRASNGVLAPLFRFLNATDQSEALVQYLEQRWANLDDFQRDMPPSMFGYQEMADIAYAYRRQGNQSRFDQALAALGEASRATLEQGVTGGDFLLTLAAYHVMAGEPELALERLAQAIDGGLIVSVRISREYPYFRELDGDPAFEAIQARMVEHLNRERASLGLAPVST
jgi:hypothetical protein